MTIGRYQIVREIARSNDIVYEAFDPQLGRKLALKELSLDIRVQEPERRPQSQAERGILGGGGYGMMQGGGPGGGPGGMPPGGMPGGPMNR